MKDGFVVMYMVKGKIYPIISNSEKEDLLNLIIGSTLDNEVNITKNPITIVDGVVKSKIEDLFDKKEMK